jgi:dienelactone hydrolase
VAGSEHFPDNYAWNLAAWLALAVGGQHSEVNAVCAKLGEISPTDPQSAEEAWAAHWVELAESLRSRAVGDEDAGHFLSAGSKYSRAAVYFLTAERDLSPRNPRKLQIYETGLAAFRKGVDLRQDSAEFVDVPFRDSSLPAIFVTGVGESERPCLVHFNGADGLKEHLYPLIAEPFRRRGVSVLVVDNPGVGGALRLRGLPFDPATEEPAGACVDYLERRSDVHAGRVGIAGWSLGGYSAPRAAAMEKRFACCVAWGGFWSMAEVMAAGLAAGQGQGLSNLAEHGQWMTGSDTVEQALDVARRVTLEGVIDRLTCPLLVVHGEDDVQVGLDQARKTHDGAINSPESELRVFTAAEGGSAHCNIDNPSVAVDYMADWVAEVLGGDPAGRRGD